MFTKMAGREPLSVFMRHSRPVAPTNAPGRCCTAGRGTDEAANRWCLADRKLSELICWTDPPVEAFQLTKERSLASGPLVACSPRRDNLHEARLLIPRVHHAPTETCQGAEGGDVSAHHFIAIGAKAAGSPVDCGRVASIIPAVLRANQGGQLSPDCFSKLGRRMHDWMHRHGQRQGMLEHVTTRTCRPLRKMVHLLVPPLAVAASAPAELLCPEALPAGGALRCEPAIPIA